MLSMTVDGVTGWKMFGIRKKTVWTKGKISKTEKKMCATEGKMFGIIEKISATGERMLGIGAKMFLIEKMDRSSLIPVTGPGQGWVLRKAILAESLVLVREELLRELQREQGKAVALVAEEDN